MLARKPTDGISPGCLPTRTVLFDMFMADIDSSRFLTQSLVVECLRNKLSYMHEQVLCKKDGHAGLSRGLDH